MAMKISQCIFIGVLALLFGTAVAEAQSSLDIQFPIAELGNCQSKEECASYCDDPEHGSQCLEFGRTHGLINEQDAKRGREAGERKKEIQDRLSQQGGPGECRSEQECRSYCDNSEHAKECIAFGEEHGLISKEDALAIRKAGFAGGPGGCKGPDECRAYCEESSHQQECIDFAETNGFMSQEEAARARKFAGKTGPGGCKGEECRQFCDNPSNAAVCLEHAEKEGLLSPEEIQRAKKFLQLAESGGPGGCKGAGECKAYCEDENNQEECFSFGKQQGLIRPEDEQRFQAGRKIHEVMQTSGGPGGCKSEDECRTYCVDPLHVEECIAFGAAHGGLPEEEVRGMLKEFQEKRFEAEGIHEFRPPEDFRRFEEEAFHRFEEFRLLEQEFRGGEFGLPPGGFRSSSEDQQGFRPPSFAGPGGCTSPDECIKYCTEHKEECFSFGPPGQPGTRPPEGGIPPGREFQQSMPQLQQNLHIEFKEGELPEFKSQEEQREFLRENFQEFRQEFTQPASEEQRKDIFQRKFEEFRQDVPPEFQQQMRQPMQQEGERGFAPYQEGIPGQMQPEFIPQNFQPQPFPPIESGVPQRPIVPFEEGRMQEFQQFPQFPQTEEFVPAPHSEETALTPPSGEIAPPPSTVESLPPPSGELTPPPTEDHPPDSPGASILQTVTSFLKGIFGR